ncbi:MAG: hypothetical protein K6F39_05535 [Lachnospiraceae bacterium]|nr:hypothetical protein [Lachnospiraceae bacterium]
MDINFIIILAVIIIAAVGFLSCVIKIGKFNDINRWLESNREFAVVRYKNVKTEYGVISPEIVAVDNRELEKTDQVSPVVGGMLDRRYYITAGEHQVKFGAYMGSIARREIHNTESTIDFQDGKVYIVSYDVEQQKFIVGHEVDIKGIQTK